MKIASLLIATSLLLVIGSCTDPEDTSTSAAALTGASCLVQGPQAWSVANVSCKSRQFAITIADGEDIDISAIPGSRLGGSAFGTGDLVIHCANGVQTVVSETCEPGTGAP
ncbi:MAG TPA: hypothetical protein VFP84_22645 [Kofleriaceae bacterium]|nr:hypothetical protein [Kofleriaceae bacterium]